MVREVIADAVRRDVPLMVERMCADLAYFDEQMVLAILDGDVSLDDALFLRHMVHGSEVT